ncbi:hypothetical protein ACIHAA_30675 [Streptomyces sp. NPDC052040]|uniref:hypothetical protein n=1 Tax=Streptomyces sp. NPDC052040 TaxID=3365682 RepID=UPI0037CFF095
MTAPTLVTCPAPGAGPLLEVIDILLQEALLAGRQTAAMAYRGPEAPSAEYRRRRNRILLALTLAAEEEIGLRFAADLPFVVSAPAVQEGAPFAGYTAQWPQLTPSQWISELFVRWKSYGPGEDTAEDESQEDAEGRRAALTDRLLRAALWHCVATDAQDAVPEAVRLIVELAATGQAMNASAAGDAVALLLRAAGEETPSARDLTRVFTRDVPASPEQWVTGPLYWPTEPAPALGRSAQRAANWMLAFVHARLDRVRAAHDFDTWVSALAEVTCAAVTCRGGLRQAVVRLPLGLKTVCAQFEELHADFPSLWVALEIRGMGAALDYSRDVEKKFRALGDTTGRRFARERALLPESLRNTSEPSAVWLRPSWRTATALVDPWPALRRVDDPSAYQTTPITEKELWAHLGQGPRSPDLPALSEMLDRYPWLHFAHGLRAEALADEGDAGPALSALVPALVLAPEQPGGWALLARLLDRRRHTAATGAALRICRTVERMRDRLHER